MLIKHQRQELGETEAGGGSSVCGSEAKGTKDSNGYGYGMTTDPEGYPGAG